MEACEVCGNEYDKAFQIRLAGQLHTFDSFELRDSGARAELRQLWLQDDRPGVEVEVGGKFFCGAHCAQRAGTSKVRDRA